MIKRLFLLLMLLPLSAFADTASSIRALAADITALVPAQTIYQCQYVLNNANNYAIKSADRLDHLDKIMAKSYLTITMTQLDLAHYQQCQQAQKIEQLKNRAKNLLYLI